MAPAEPIHQFMEVEELSLDVFLSFIHSSQTSDAVHTNFNQAQVTGTNNITKNITFRLY